uniref:Uncharacterized protein n=1 Tax=Ralstonia solanacearum TaxID=305 RepID=A0A0S4TVA0_RALSL|nr:protein of unknown function [Ralstonia solanacearum]
MDTNHFQSFAFPLRCAPTFAWPTSATYPGDSPGAEAAAPGRDPVAQADGQIRGRPATQTATYGEQDRN